MENNSKAYTDNQKDVAKFFAKLLVIWVSWKVILFALGVESKPISERFFPRVSTEWEYLNNEVRWIVLDGAETVLNALGYSTENSGYLLNIKDKQGIALGNYCLGFQLMYYFIMLVIIAPFGFIKKILASVSGIFITIFLNIFRIAALCWLVVFHPSLMAISHDYIFNIVVLGVLMVFYFFLVRKK
ncbi:MAG: exosortase/archaeosortase family protein [Bacteroidetes bacterium]|nr:exosortase/archaeosortase family protein [Bacteroidota bacterium]